MQIQKLIIDEYGAFKDRTFTLDGGMNVIEGDNESGKSTVLSFIRFMLYGMPRKSAGTVTERDRGISWSGGVAGGSMEVTVPDKNGELRAYRIERHGQLRGAAGHENYAESLKIIDLATGTEVFEGQEPGKALLGISQETFVSTACIRQLECTSVDGVGVNASIENLLFAANEGINTEKAVGKLDEIRKTLLHKNEKGGLLFELEAEKLILEDKLARAKEASEAIVAKEAIVEATSALESEVGSALRECEDMVNLRESCAVLRRFDELHEEEQTLEAWKNALDKLQVQKGYDGPLPTRDTILETQTLERKLADDTTAYAMRRAAFGQASHAADGDRNLADYAHEIEAQGGKEMLLTKFARFSKKRKTAKPLSILSLAAGGIALLIGALAVAFSFAFGIPLLYPASLQNLFQALSSGSSLSSLAENYNVTVYHTLAFAIVAFGILLTVLGVLLSVSARENEKRRAEWLESLGIFSPDLTRNAFAHHLSRCLENLASCNAYDEAIADAKVEMNHYEERLNARLSECLAKLATFDVILGDTSPESVSEALRKTADILSALCAERERIEGEIRNHEALTETMRQNLGEYNEHQLRGAVGDRDPLKILESVDVEKLEMERRYNKEQLAAATAKRIALEKELIAMVAAAENPAKLAAKLDELNDRLAEKRFQYQSIMMAMESIDIASDNLRRSVTPRIRERAGILMGRITDGKYKELGVAQDMSVNVFAGNSTRSIDVLSKGTRDAAYLALRMALANLVSPGNPMPLTLDESLSLLDEKRATNVLTMLHEYSENEGQCLLFTCHKREGQLLASIGAFNHIHLT